jgi:Beta-propeller repeat
MPRHHALASICLSVLTGSILTSASVAQTSQTLPFVENQGQWELPLRFAAQRGASTVRVFQDGFELLRQNGDAAPGHGESLRLHFTDSRAETTLQGRDEMPTYFNYLGGSEVDSITRVKTWSGVDFGQLYPGVDLWLRFDQGLLEYDLEVQSLSALRQIVVQCDGAEMLSLAEDGALLIHMEQDQIRQAAAKTWIRTEDGRRTPVLCSYKVLDAHHFGFEVSNWTGEGALVIDPGLEWSTYLGGSSLDLVFDMVTDSNGAIFVTGDTTSPDFPVSQGTFGGTSDAFVAKYDANGQMIWASYLGGGANEDGKVIALTSSGSILLAGITGSSDFPITAGVIDSNFVNGESYVAQLSADGTTIEWATFLGGDLGDEIWAMEVDVNGNITVAGETESDNFPVTGGAYDISFNGTPTDLFVSRLNSDATNLVWSTFIGGAGQDESRDLALDASGAVVLGGYTNAADFPTTLGAYSRSFLGGGFNQEDAFVLKLKNDGSNLIWSTFIAGTDEDEVTDLSLDLAGNIVLTGWTSSTDFPVVAGSFDLTPNGDKDAFLATLSADGSALLYGSYFGGSGLDEAQALALDANGAAVFAGNSSSNNLPSIAGSYDSIYNGGGFGDDGFLAVIELNLTGAGDLKYSSYFGGALGSDSIQAVAISASGDVILAGGTTSSDFHTTPGASDESFNGMVDAFLAVLDMAPGPILSQTPLFRGQSADLTVSNLSPGETVHLTYSLVGLGNGPCLPQLGGLCLDLQNQVTLLGQATANSGGVAVFTAQIPINAPLIGVATQALVQRGISGAQSAKSNPVTDTIQP